MKSQKLFKLAALMLALVFCIGAFAACAPQDEVTDPNATTDPNAGQSGDGEVNEDTLTVGYAAFDRKFSPFFAETAYDQDVQGITQVGMMTTDRTGAIVYNAIEGETREYNGTPYTYKGAADINVDRLENETVYTIKLKEGILFSDGEEANADDIIFYMYVLLDPYYDGASSLSSVNVKGYLEYRYNNSAAGTVDPDAIIDGIDENEELQTWVKETIINPILEAEWEWIQELYNPEYVYYANYADQREAYPNPKDLFYVYYTPEVDEDGNPLLDTTDMEIDAITAKLQEEIGYDYAHLGLAYAGDPGYFRDQTMIDYAYELALASAEGTEVPNVEGIKKIDEYTVQVTCEGFFANAVYQVCGGSVTPMHYYGSADLYDYENNKFGFENRTSEGMDRIKSVTEKPMGAGPYKFIEYDKKTVFFEANEHYYLGAPKIPYMQWKETAEADYVSGVATGAIDVANPSGSLEKMDEIGTYNKDTGTETGETITSSLVWNLGYGYIGLNAGTMNVGGEPDSDASKNLRKAIATVLAVHRAVSIDSYYGNAAAVIEYPISSTSWAAPQTSDEGYQVAFSVDVDGNPIYTEGMTQTEREEAAIQAAIGFFKAAGYTFDEATGKFTAAPDGAKLEYECIVPGEGTGDHPVANVINNTSEALKTIGITLELNDPTDTTLLWAALDTGNQEMWAAAWGSTIDPDMYQVYHSNNRLPDKGGASNSTQSNHYQIADAELDELIMAARESDDENYRKTVYKQCLDIIMDWAVEVPAYQRKNLIIFSTQRLNHDTLTKDITTYWGWMAEIEKLELAD